MGKAARLTLADASRMRVAKMKMLEGNVGMIQEEAEDWTYA